MHKRIGREGLKTGVAVGMASASPAANEMTFGKGATTGQPLRGPTTARERLLMDFGWRFHLGHACDAGRDFGFGGDGAFSNSGKLLGPSRENFDNNKWRSKETGANRFLPIGNPPPAPYLGMSPQGADLTNCHK